MITDVDKVLIDLSKDVAVVVEIQKGCQKSQAQTTINIDKLAISVDKLSHDTVYLSTLERRVGDLESSASWLRKTLTTTVITAGMAILWYLFGAPK